MSLRPREYGQPDPRGFESALDGLTTTIAWTRSRGYRRWLAAYIGGMNPVEGDLSRETAEALARRTETTFRDALPYCEPFYVSEVVSAFLAEASRTFPQARLDESDLLVPNGFVWFAQPLLGFGENALVGLAWATGRLLTDNLTVVVAALTEEGGFVGPCRMAPVTLGQIPDVVREATLVRLAISFWLLARQRVFVSDVRTVGRPVRRRARLQEIKTVTVVDLRRREYPLTDGSRKVDWTHRWPVHGFWRNQWYPKEGRHRPLWIADYVKGPPDKPFVAKARAFEFTR